MFEIRKVCYLSTLSYEASQLADNLNGKVVDSCNVWFVLG